MWCGCFFLYLSFFWRRSLISDTEKENVGRIGHVYFVNFVSDLNVWHKTDKILMRQSSQAKCGNDNM